MKDPYEDIVPFPADGFPFLLDDSTIALRWLVQRLTWNLYYSYPLPPPFATANREMYDELHQKPQRGDIVIERSRTRNTSLADCLGGFGVLLEHRTEWMETEEEFLADVREMDEADISVDITPRTMEKHREQRMRESAWYVQYGPLPAHVFRWNNAECIRVPVTLDDLKKLPKEVWKTP